LTFLSPMLLELLAKAVVSLRKWLSSRSARYFFNWRLSMIQQRRVISKCACFRDLRSRCPMPNSLFGLRLPKFPNLHKANNLRLRHGRLNRKANLSHGQLNHGTTQVAHGVQRKAGKNLPRSRGIMTQAAHGVQRRAGKNLPRSRRIMVVLGVLVIGNPVSGTTTLAKVLLRTTLGGLPRALPNQAGMLRALQTQAGRQMVGTRQVTLQGNLQPCHPCPACQL